MLQGDLYVNHRHDNEPLVRDKYLELCLCKSASFQTHFLAIT